MRIRVCIFGPPIEKSGAVALAPIQCSGGGDRASQGELAR